MPTFEEELVQRLLARDAQAMRTFYQRYGTRLNAAVLRIVRNRQTAEDVVQGSMVKVWQAIGSYAAAQGQLYTWAAKICCNTAIDHLRTSRARMSARSTSLENSPELNYAAPTSFRPEHVGLWEWLGELQPKYRQGYPQAEAAQALDVPIGTVKTWNGRALQLLAQRPV